MKIRTLQEYINSGEQPDVVIWRGCASSLDPRARKILLAFFKLLDKFSIKFAIIEEELCTGDPALRAGDSATFITLALQNISLFKQYGIKELVTICPHCFNCIKKDYPKVDPSFSLQIFHHTTYLVELIKSGRIKIDKNGMDIPTVFHDPCYLGRGNGEYDSPRFLIKEAGFKLNELEQSREKSYCCGAGGAQIFKESEKGTKEVFITRTEQCLKKNPKYIITACPFCNLMLNDGINYLQKENISVLDVVQLLLKSEA